MSDQQNDPFTELDITASDAIGKMQSWANWLNISGLPVATSIGAALQARISGIQGQRLNEFHQLLIQKFQGFDQQKLDRDYLESGEFHNLVLNILKAAAEVDEQRKLEVLRDAFLNSIDVATRTLQRKDVLMGVLGNISATEVDVLKTLAALMGKEPGQPAPLNLAVSERELSRALDMSMEDVRFWFETLTGRRLVMEFGVLGGLSAKEGVGGSAYEIRFTLLGSRLLQLIEAQP